MNVVVVSLFNGLSGGRIALDGVEHLNVLRYYSSEVDKYAISVADYNYPQDIKYKLGDVTKVDGVALREEIKRDFGDVKVMLIGGSPCQGFSMAGKMKGSSTKCGKEVTTLNQYLTLKEMGFEFDGQSYLFWEYIRIREELKPDYFMLENVKITKKWLPMFNEAMGVEPVLINSALVSAQNRQRYYWCNWDVEQPQDKGLVIRDILEDGIADLVKNQGKEVYRPDIKKSHCLMARDWKGFGNQAMTGVRLCELKDFNKDSTCHHIADATDIKGNESIKRVYAESGKAPTVTTMQGGHRQPKVLIDSSIKPCVAKNIREQHKDIENSDKDFYQMKCDSGWQDNKIGLKKTPTLRAGNSSTYVKAEAVYRKLTPLECERLQTLPNNFTSMGLDANGKEVKISNSQRYKMIGNGWTTDVVAWVLGFIR